MKRFQTASGEPPVLHRNTANLMQTMLDEVKRNLTILPELQALIPPLQPGETEQLTANILRDGCREPLLVWQTTRGVVVGSADQSPLNVLIDGHNRYAICQANKIDFKVALREFPSLAAVREFMIDNQLGRRNLSPEQMSYLRGLKYRNERQATGRPVTETDNVGERTQDRLAREFRVSPRTLHRDRDFSAGIDRLTAELKQDILTGKVKVAKELIQAVGRTASSEMPPLALPELLAYPAAEAETKVAKREKNTPALLQEVVQRVKRLDPAAANFATECDTLIGMLTDLKKSIY